MIDTVFSENYILVESYNSDLVLFNKAFTYYKAELVFAKKI